MKQHLGYTFWGLCTVVFFGATANANSFTVGSQTQFDGGTYVTTRIEGSGDTAQLTLGATASGSWSTIAGSATYDNTGNMAYDGNRYIYFFQDGLYGQPTQLYRIDTDTDQITFVSTSTISAGSYGRSHWQLTTVTGGRVYQALSYGSTGATLGWYDIGSGTWGKSTDVVPSTSSYGGSRTEFVAMQAGSDGFVYMIESSYRAFFSYNPATDIFTQVTPTNSLGCNTYSYSWTLSSDGAGGILYSCGSVGRLDTPSGVLSGFTSLPAGTLGHHRIAYDQSNDTIYLTQGRSGAGFSSYSVGQNSWRQLPPTPVVSWDESSYYNYSSLAFVPQNVAVPKDRVYFAPGGTGPFYRFDVATDYVATGIYTSKVHDTLGLPTYQSVYWSDNQPPGTTLKVQIATRASLADTPIFVGPDGLATSYYTTSTGTPIHASHHGQRWVQFRAYLTSTDATVSPRISSISVSYAFGSMAITTATPLLDGTVGKNFTPLTLAANGGVTPYTWSLVAGAGTLPAGLILNTATGEIAGTPTTAGNATFTIQSTDDGAPVITATKQMSINILPAPVAPSIIDTAGRVGAVGSPYVYDLDGIAEATGTQPITWSKVGTTPAAFDINPNTGVVTWTPGASDVPTANISIVATNEAGSSRLDFEVVVTPAPVGPSIQPTSNPSANVGIPYRYDSDNTAQATGTPPFTWAVTNGPAGYLIDQANGGVDWTPLAADEGSQSITISATNTVTTVPVLYTYTITVGPKPAPPVIDETATLTGTIGAAYQYDANADNTATATSPLTVVWSAPNPPLGFLIDSTTGVIDWTPQATGTILIALRATSAAGVDIYDFNVEVSASTSCAQLPATPSLLSPSSDPNATSTHYELLWLPVFGAQSYLIDIVATPMDGTPSFGTTPAIVEATSYKATALPLTRYAWRVTAQTEACVGQSSDTWAFTTGAGSTSLVAIAKGRTAQEAAGGQQAHNGPVTGTAQLTVLYSSDASIARLDYPITEIRWDFGDGTPLVFGPTLSTVQHTFALPGGYRTHVTVVDAGGEEATDEVQILVTNAKGHVPPQADANVLPARGAVTQDFLLQADVVKGSGEIVAVLWEMGDGSLLNGASLSYTYAEAGTYIVHLTVVDANGLSAEDFAAITVTGADGQEAPRVRAYANPPSGDLDVNSKLEVTLTCDARPSSATDLYTYEWDFDDGSPIVATSIAAAGLQQQTHTFVVQSDGRRTFRVSCTATASNGGLSSTDIIPVTITSSGGFPPRIMTVGGTEACVGQPYDYNGTKRAAARGGQGAVWQAGKQVGSQSINRPDGFSIDPSTGIIDWIPTDTQQGLQDVTLWVDNTKGTDSQTFQVNVRDCDPVAAVEAVATPPEKKSGGCHAMGTGLWLWLVGVPWVFRRRRR